MESADEINVRAVIINYGTPHLTQRAVWSLRSLYPHLPITVVDNASPDDSLSQFRALQQEMRLLEIVACERNLHHGPGLDFAIRRTDAPWVLTFDSDCIAYRRDFLEQMLQLAESRSAYMVGSIRNVADTGYPAERTSATSHQYVHPKCALVRRSTYHTLLPFEKHGAPCLTNQIQATRQGKNLIHFPVEDFVFHQSRGTVEHVGYQLGWRGALNKLRHWGRRLKHALSQSLPTR